MPAISGHELIQSEVEGDLFEARRFFLGEKFLEVLAPRKSETEGTVSKAD